MLLAGCAKDPASSGPGEGLPMGIEASLSGSKASLTTDDLQEFWLQVDCAGDAAYSYFVAVSKSATGWVANRQLLWKSATATTNYCAAFFSGHDFTQAEFAGGVDLSVPADQSTQAGLNAADLLTLKATSTTYETTTDGVLPVALSHGLAKVNFVLSLGSNFYDNQYGRSANPVTAFTVGGANLGFNFQPTTGAVAVTAGTEADITPFASSYAPGTATAKTSVATYEAILAPQTFAAGALCVAFSVGVKNYVWTNADAITLTAGQTVNLPVSVTAAPPMPKLNGHAYVDMGEVDINGVKKHLLCATCNVGADNPWDYGDYYAWGETATKGTYTWDNYAFGSHSPFSRYTGSDYVTLLSEDDAASQLWGGSWRIPTFAEWEALLDENYYTWTWTADYLGDGSNHAGRIVTRKNVSGTDPCAGNSIFFPAAGYWKNTGLDHAGSIGYYWSSSLYTDYTISAWFMTFSNDGFDRINILRYFGMSLRPVVD